ncbi:putative F-box protein At1g50870 [Aegilops tauschii subsp. strangulata]|uniref:putative F-box protein At1g50870 n=1 Tax=Aegilops tauschii subsp. strangulata TaxID=200361 RepID=UPI001ABC8F6D|nr:putative F-box protein At1g47790 [Aegilops tauschii subsp. strangulata]
MISQEFLFSFWCDYSIQAFAVHIFQKKKKAFAVQSSRKKSSPLSSEKRRRPHPVNRRRRSPPVAAGRRRKPNHPGSRFNSMEAKKSKLESHPGFTDDLILEILARLPARSLRRFKCVSMPWRDLISDPAHRKKLRQTLAGFLYMTDTDRYNGGRHHFASVSGDGAAAPFDPSVPYLQPNKEEGITQVDSCNGLLLYRRYSKMVVRLPPCWAADFRFVVCNPATGRWVDLPLPTHPEPPAKGSMTALAFDPAVSSHFHVLHFEQREAYITGVDIYSSRTGAWTHRDSGLADKVSLCFGSGFVFVGGMMYLIGTLGATGIKKDCVLLGVDMEGKVWKTISVPYPRRFGTIGLSQGCLHYAIASVNDTNKVPLSVIELWCLKDCDGKELVLKHTANINKLVSKTGKTYMVVEFHPDRDTIFLTSCRRDTLVSYDTRLQKVGCILNLEKRNTQRFLPYVPLYSESFADADGQ